MKTPKRLLPLLEEGLIDEVIGQLMSGKEATVYVVRQRRTPLVVRRSIKTRSSAASGKRLRYREAARWKNSRQRAR